MYYVFFIKVLSKARYLVMKKNNESFNFKCVGCSNILVAEVVPAVDNIIPSLANIAINPAVDKIVPAVANVFINPYAPAGRTRLALGPVFSSYFSIYFHVL
jgi:hypothetical protein